ncbi:MAG: nucleotide exchange factor GrpE [Clostridiales bacterium]|nr:nucleotide exchange factor GrpE [Clostridiales bacterium]
MKDIDFENITLEEAKEELKKTLETKEALEKENEELLKEIEDLKPKADEYKDKWIRNVAEFDNYKKRNAKIWQEAFIDGKVDIILKALAIGDNLERAIAMDIDEKTKEGLVLLYRQFNDILTGMEVTEINPVGEKFDPLYHEAVMQVEGADGEESDNVKQVFQKGYQLKDKVIRYAKVSVIK